MASKSTILPALRDEIQTRFGRNIVFASDCNELSHHIYKSIRVQISAQTLRRLFGFIEDGTESSDSTISYLLRYCGINTMNELLKHTENHSNTKPDEDKIRFIKEFYSIELSAGVDFNYQKACGNIAKQLFKAPNLLNSLASFLSSNQVAQIFFFERHPYIDGLCNGYSPLLKLYAQEKKTSEAQLFAACLLHLGSILAENKTEASKYILQINQFSADNSIHPFVQARKIMANLTHAWLLGNEEEIAIWTEIAFTEERKQKRGNFKEAYFPFFQFILADAFNFIGKYDEALEMVQIAEHYYIRLPDSPIESGYYECLSLIKAIALFNTGRKNEGKSLLNEVNNEEIIFSSKKYFTLQLLNLELQLTKPQSAAKRQKIVSHIDTLVKETGFTVFGLKH